MSATDCVAKQDTICIIASMTFRAIIDRWDSKAALGADLGIPRGTIQQWWNRDSIPAERFAEIEEAAAKRGFAGITAEVMLDILRRRRERRDAAPLEAQA
jgi:hypothetical protein